MRNIAKLALTILVMVSALSNCTIQAQNTYTVKKVVIDAGHGGKDPGALGKKSKEKNLTLSIALKLGRYIEENVPGVTVQYTRKTDVFLDLKRRAEIANEAKADVFISIHINACNNPKVYGASTYVNGHAKDAANLEIQKQENGGDEISPEEYITLSNIQKANHGYSTILAGKIQDQFRTRVGRKDLGVKQANFAVLWRTNMTAVLVECGYISNANEEKYMMTDDGQSYIASGIYRAFKEYKKIVEGKASPDIKTGTTAAQQAANQKASETKTTTTTTTATTAAEPKADDKVYFRVQVKWSKQRLSTSGKEFKGLKGVEEIKIDGLYKYTVGKTQNYNEILKLQAQTREKIKDAFVIATKGNKLIKLNDAKKELGIK